MWHSKLQNKKYLQVVSMKSKFICIFILFIIISIVVLNTKPLAHDIIHTKNVIWIVAGTTSERSRLDNVRKKETIIDFSYTVHPGSNGTSIKNVKQTLVAPNVLKTSCTLIASIPSASNDMAPYISIRISYQ